MPDIVSAVSATTRPPLIDRARVRVGTAPDILTGPAKMQLDFATAGLDGCDRSETGAYDERSELT